jgi:quinol monooxygenase YgiN
MNTEKKYSVEIIRYNLQADQHADFEKAYAEAGKHLKGSKYCLGYQVIHGNEEPNHCIVIIHWTSKDDHLNGFRKSPEFMPFFNLVKLFFNNIEEMKHYDITDAWEQE